MYQEDRTKFNFYVPNNIASKYGKQKLTEIKDF